MRDFESLVTGDEAEVFTLNPRMYAYLLYKHDDGFLYEVSLENEIKKNLERRDRILNTWHKWEMEDFGDTYRLYREYGLTPKQAYKLAVRLWRSVEVHFEDYVAMAKDELGDDFRADDEIYRLRTISIHRDNLYHDEDVSELAGRVSFERLFFEVQLQDEVSDECGPVWLEKKSRGWG